MPFTEEPIEGQDSTPEKVNQVLRTSVGESVQVKKTNFKGEPWASG